MVNDKEKRNGATNGNVLFICFLFIDPIGSKFFPFRVDPTFW